MAWSYDTPGIPDELFSRREDIPITKEEIRAVAISKARLKRGDFVIDVGCGSGSLSVESALQVAPEGRVFAVDCNEEAVKLTEENASKFGVKEFVKVIHGRAPEALKGLPSANAVFVGGSGGAIHEIIEASSEKLKGGGRIVIDTILLETCYDSLTKLREMKFTEVDVAQLIVAKGLETRLGTLWQARNPVVVISATK